MSLTKITQIREVYIISEAEKEAVKTLMQGAIYSWINVNGKAEFAVRDLAGGGNRYWDGTPLGSLYREYYRKTKDTVSANKRAGQALGWLVKRMLHDDKRLFQQIPGLCKYLQMDRKAANTKHSLSR